LKFEVEFHSGPEFNETTLVHSANTIDAQVDWQTKDNNDYSSSSSTVSSSTVSSVSSSSSFSSSTFI
jgi:hypothetical protein